jgi:hypothetical protein
MQVKPLIAPLSSFVTPIKFEYKSLPTRDERAPPVHVDARDKAKQGKLVVNEQGGVKYENPPKCSCQGGNEKCSCNEPKIVKPVKPLGGPKEPVFSEGGMFKALLSINIGGFNISKVIVAYLVGYIISEELAEVLALDIAILQFFDIEGVK